MATQSDRQQNSRATVKSEQERRAGTMATDCVVLDMEIKNLTCRRLWGTGKRHGEVYRPSRK